MIDAVGNGQTIFYGVYTEEKKENPKKANTGLFFFPGKTGAPFAIIAPGGGLRMSAPSTRAFPVPWPSADRDTTRSC
jgi:hypothetical protein